MKYLFVALLVLGVSKNSLAQIDTSKLNTHTCSCGANDPSQRTSQRLNGVDVWLCLKDANSLLSPKML